MVNFEDLTVDQKQYFSNDKCPFCFCVLEGKYFEMGHDFWCPICKEIIYRGYDKVIKSVSEI